MIIAAVKNINELTLACKTEVSMVFWLSPSILTLDTMIRTAHAAGKQIFLHIDLAEGIGKDREGLLYVKKRGADGIISTRVNIIKAARETGLQTVQRFFMVDSHSVNTALEGIRASRTDMVEVMPGIVTKVIADLHKKLSIPIIAGGLLDSKEEVEKALESGAAAISTSRAELWKVNKEVEKLF